MIHEIKSLNYIVSGQKEKIINMDVDDTLNWSFVTDENRDENSSSDFRNAYSAHRLLKIKENPSEENKDIIYALFDFKDLAIKSDFSKNQLNCVYGPKLDSNPIGFCSGSGSNAFGLTDSSKTGALATGTNLLETRNRRIDGYKTDTKWQYRLDDGDSATFTYAPLKDFGNDLSSYYSYITNEPSLSAERFDKIFYPKTNHENASRNFLYEFFTGSEYNDYNTGNFNGNVFAAKNMYDAEYSMEMLSSGGIADGRKYVGIGSVGGHLFLKYHDCRQFKDKSKGSATDISGTTTYNVETVDEDYSNTYQKVEILDSINRFVTKSNHKANLYSIKLYNLGLEQHERLEQNLDKIKADIKKNVRMIAEKLAPAHTQLFDVYIES